MYGTTPATLHGGPGPGMDPMLGAQVTPGPPGPQHGYSTGPNVPVNAAARSRSLRRSMGDVLPYGNVVGPVGPSPSKSGYINHSISQPPSARASPIGFGSRLMSPTRHRATGRHPYGISRSHNNSPLTLPAEHLPQSLSTSSAYGPGFPGYYDDPGSPVDGFGGGRIMHRNMGGHRPPLRSYHSIEREPGYRDRSFERMIGDTGRVRPRDRSLDRSLYLRDDSLHTGGPYGRNLDRTGDPLLDDPNMYGRDSLMNSSGRPPMLGIKPTSSGMPYGPPGVPGLPPTSGRLSATNDQFIMELQARLNDIQMQYNHVKRELDATTQKLSSCMHSIKTFWSPELKKERALRKEEAAKYALINDQLKILRSENQVRNSKTELSD